MKASVCCFNCGAKGFEKNSYLKKNNGFGLLNNFSNKNISMFSKIMQQSCQFNFFDS